MCAENTQWASLSAAQRDAAEILDYDEAMWNAFLDPPSQKKQVNLSFFMCLFKWSRYMLYFFVLFLQDPEQKRVRVCSFAAPCTATTTSCNALLPRVALPTLRSTPQISKAQTGVHPPYANMQMTVIATNLTGAIGELMAVTARVAGILEEDMTDPRRTTAHRQWGAGEKLVRWTLTGLACSLVSCPSFRVSSDQYA